MKNKYKRFDIILHHIFGIYDVYDNHTQDYIEAKERLLTCQLPIGEAEEFLGRLVIDLNKLYVTQ